MSKGKVGYPWESTRDIYQHIPPIYGLYNGCIGQYGVIFWERLRSGTLPRVGPTFSLHTNFILLMAEIRRSPVEVGSWNPIIYRVNRTIQTVVIARFQPSTVPTSQSFLFHWRFFSPMAFFNFFALGSVGFSPIERWVCWVNLKMKCHAKTLRQV